MSRTLIVGHRGMLGSELVALLERMGRDVAGRDLPEIDITDEASVARAFDEAAPSVVVNCAAWTAVDDAEAHRDEAMRVNAEGPGILARASARRGVKLVHLSTDFVFDGTKATPYAEDDTPCPVSVYGETKLRGERAVAAAGGDYLIVRTAWLYGAGGRNFVTTILKAARERDELTVVDDQRGSPTWTCDLARALIALVDARATGIVHAAGSGACSWYEFACAIVKRGGLATPVRPITSDQLDRPATRPANSVLDTSRLKALTGFTFPDWRASLATFMNELCEEV